MKPNPKEVSAKPKLWSFLFIRIGLLTALAGICMQMFMSAFPQYLRMRGFTATQMGLVASGYTICAMVMRFFAGNLIDARGRRLMCLVGLAIFGIPIIGFYTSTSVALIVAFRFIQGMGSSLSSIAMGTMPPDVLPKERMAEGIGYYGLFNSMATAIGPAVGIALVVGGNMDGFFIVGFLFILAAFGVTLTINYEKKQKSASGDENAAVEISPEEEAQELEAERKALEDEKSFFLWKFFDKNAMPAAIVSISIFFSACTIQNFVSTYGLSLGLTGVGSFFTVQAAFMVVSRLSSGKISGKIGVFKTILIGLVFDAMAMFLLSAMSSNTLLFAAAACRGLGGGFYFPLLNVLAVQNAAKSRRGKATSAYYASFDIGSGIGAPFWGFIADNFGGFKTVYFGAGLFYIVSIIVTYLLVGKREKQEKLRTSEGK